MVQFFTRTHVCLLHIRTQTHVYSYTRTHSHGYSQTYTHSHVSTHTCPLTPHEYSSYSYGLTLIHTHTYSHTCTHVPTVVHIYSHPYTYTNTLTPVHSHNPYTQSHPSPRKRSHRRPCRTDGSFLHTGKKALIYVIFLLFDVEIPSLKRNLSHTLPSNIIKSKTP